MFGLLTLIFVFSLAASFLFSGMEAGVFALSRLRIRQQMRAGNPRAAALYGYLERPEDFLWTILIGNTTANFAALALMAVGLKAWLDDRVVLFALTYVAGVILFYAFIE